MTFTTVMMINKQKSHYRLHRYQFIVVIMHKIRQESYIFGISHTKLSTLKVLNF